MNNNVSLSNKARRWLFSVFLSAICVSGVLGLSTARADLLGVGPLGFPLISSIGNMDDAQFNAATGVFAISETPPRSMEIQVPGVPFPIKITGPGASFSIVIRVDPAGNLLGPTTDTDLKITGNINSPFVPGSPYSGVLLTGEIKEFGFFNQNGTDKFDFRFRLTGGALTRGPLARLYAGKDLGAIMTLEDSTFKGHFWRDFEGLPKTNVGPIDKDGQPDIEIEKFTNGHDGDNANGVPIATPPIGPFIPGANPVAQVAVGVPVVWTYRVSNTGTEDLVDIVVTDAEASSQGATILCPNTGSNTIPFLAAGDTVDCTASLPGGAVNLQTANVNTVPGCKDGRPTYENTGIVKGTAETSGKEVSDEDDSHYCNPLIPKVDLEKFTNGQDADDRNGADVPRIAVGGTVAWTYRVRNTGPETLVNLIVTDAEAAAQGASISCPGSGNDTIDSLAVGAFVDCTASLAGGARNLSSNDPDVVPGCGDRRPTYENTGKVTGEGEFSMLPVEDSDPSHYCNPQEPGVEIIKFTNNQDADDPDGTDVPRIAPGAQVTWTYRVTNIGNTDVPFAQVSVTDSISGVDPVFDSVLVETPGGTANIFEPGDVWLYKATGIAIDLENPPGGGVGLELVPGVCTEGNDNIPPSTAYTNTGTVSIPGDSDDNPSSYCNPLEPEVELEKFTNGHDGDNANGIPTPTPPNGPFTPGANRVAEVAVGNPVIWTYRVRNTGTETLVNLTVTDAAAAFYGATIECPAGSGTNTIASLLPGDTLDCEATLPGGALKLQFGDLFVVPGCSDARPTYMNTGDVVGFGEESGTFVSDMDDSHYCNPPSGEPRIDIEKVTDSRSNQNILPPDFDNEDTRNRPGVPVIPTDRFIVWLYKVTNTGDVPFADTDVLVEDTVEAVNDTLSLVDKGDGDDILSPGEEWLYRAGGFALDLENPPNPLPEGVKIVADGCSRSEIAPGVFAGPAPTYQNDATVTWTQDPTVTDKDRSHYCNPPGEPKIEIEKLTNGFDADNGQGNAGTEIPEIAPGQLVTWTYLVTNTGSVGIPRADVTVTDSILGVNPVFDPSSDQGNDNILSPNEEWRYTASRRAPDLSDPRQTTNLTIIEGCRRLDITGKPYLSDTYENIGRVTIPGDSDEDPSHWCNPAPEIDIEKLTNGFDADDGQGNAGTEIPEIAPGQLVNWTYIVTNTGTVSIPLADVTVTDDIAGVNPVFDPTSDNGDFILSPNEKWRYTASRIAPNLSDPGQTIGLTIIQGCRRVDSTGTPFLSDTYENIGTVKIPGDSDEDPSHWCNPKPGIEIEKLTNGFDADNGQGNAGTEIPEIAPGQLVTWTYLVTNTGTSPIRFFDVKVTDSVPGVVPVFDPTSDNGDFILSPNEQWRYTASRQAPDLSDPSQTTNLTIIEGCRRLDITGKPYLSDTYENIGRVTIPGDSDEDPSHWCNPAPEIDIEKWTNGFDADDGQGNAGTEIPEIAPGQLVSWTYIVTNTGTVSIPLADVTVTDDIAGVNPVFDPASDNGDFILSPNEKWRYTASRIAPNLSDPGQTIGLTIIQGCRRVDSTGTPFLSDTYENIGTVKIPGDSDEDPSHWCNPQRAKLGDRVWEDLNGNGIQDCEDTNGNGIIGDPGDQGPECAATGIPGAIVELFPSIGNFCITSNRLGFTQTDANGFYLFDDLDPNRYCLRFTPPRNFCPFGDAEFTQQNQGTDDARDSDPDIVTGVTGIILLAAGDDDRTWDAGIICPARLGDRVWRDLNRNGLQDCEDTNNNGIIGDPGDQGPECAATGVQDVTVNLREPGDQNGCGAFLDTMQTDQNGFYLFDGLNPGDYCVEWEKPGGLECTMANVGDDNEKDSDGTDTGTSCETVAEVISLVSKQDDRSWDLGLVPPPDCDISVEKTCEIVSQPAPPSGGKCDGKLQQFTMVWTGGTIHVSGVPNDAPGGEVEFHDEVTFFGPFSNNDVVVHLSGAANGISTFHVSCSDDDMNTPDDCGKFQGDGKKGDGGINLWRLEGWIDKNGDVLDCNLGGSDPGGFPTETEVCEYTPVLPSGGNCKDIKDITGLTLVWGGPDGVNLVSEVGQRIDGIDNGDVIHLDTPKDQTGNDVDVFLSGSVSGSSQFHISCSDDDMNGSEDCGKYAGNGKKNSSGLINDWLFGGMLGEKGQFGCPGIPDGSGSAEVVYGFLVVNPNDEAILVRMVDKKLGIDLTGTIAPQDTLELITDPITITPGPSGLFENTVVVNGKTIPSGATCEDMDSVVVKRNQPTIPPSAATCKDIKKITALSMIWDGPDDVTMRVEGGTVISNIDNGNQVNFGVAGLGNDVDVFLSGRGFSGQSTFHVSCSDKDMDGSDDCGKNQGNGKNNDSGLINTWRLDGMTGEKGRFACGLPNTGQRP